MEPIVLKERVRCRPIGSVDLGAVATLLLEGFAGRSRESIETGLARLTARDVPDGMQRYGYCLDTGSRLVGVILLIASERRTENGTALFYNVASWYVLQDFRAYAQLLVSMALKNKQVTYMNVSPAPHTWEIVEKQGYTRYCSGLFLAAAILKRPASGIVIEPFGKPEHKDMTDFAMLLRHQQMGCEVVVVRSGNQLTGYVFRRYRIRAGRLPLPAMFVIHAPDRDELIRIAGNLGRHFLSRAAPFLVMDADGPVAGLLGLYTELRGRKYFKGPCRPALSDLADTEYAVFGV